MKDGHCNSFLLFIYILGFVFSVPKKGQNEPWPQTSQSKSSTWVSFSSSFYPSLSHIQGTKIAAISLWVCVHPRGTSLPLVIQGKWHQYKQETSWRTPFSSSWWALAAIARPSLVPWPRLEFSLCPPPWYWLYWTRSRSKDQNWEKGWFWMSLGLSFKFPVVHLPWTPPQHQGESVECYKCGSSLLLLSVSIP